MLNCLLGVDAGSLLELGFLLTLKWVNKQKKHIPLKLVQQLDWKWVKKQNAQRKPLKALQKAWRTTDQCHFERLKESLATWKLDIKKLLRVHYFSTVLFLPPFFYLFIFSHSETKNTNKSFWLKTALESQTVFLLCNQSWHYRPIHNISN